MIERPLWRLGALSGGTHTSCMAVAAVHEKMDQRASQEQQPE
jgi:hypothetical protein